LEFHDQAIVTMARADWPPCCSLIAVFGRFFPKGQSRLVLLGLNRARISGMSGSTSPGPGHCEKQPQAQVNLTGGHGSFFPPRCQPHQLFHLFAAIDCQQLRQGIGGEEDLTSGAAPAGTAARLLASPNRSSSG